MMCGMLQSFTATEAGGLADGQPKRRRVLVTGAAGNTGVTISVSATPFNSRSLNAVRAAVGRGVDGLKLRDRARGQKTPGG
jgi:hypothetical protein